MIDFRYHVVSIVAVFLALAIGIVLGATALQGHTIDALTAASNLQKNELQAANARNDAYQAQVGANEQFLLSAEPKLLGGLLTGDSVVIVTEPGASGAVVNGVKQAADNAGATVTGEVALQPKFYDVSGANQSSLSSINIQIAGTDNTVLDAAADPQTQYQQQAAQLIATAILNKTVDETGLSQASAQTLLGYYAQAGYLNLSGTPTDRATLAVLVTPQSAPAGGANDPANQVLLALAQQFANASAVTIVAGDTTGSAQSGSAMSVLRSSSVSGSVSSVDNADTALGQISTIEAISSQLLGGKPNSYGVSGASAVSPVPSATATTSPSQTSSPTSSATSSPTTSSSPHPTATTSKPPRKR